ncbi:M15 family metallopeptidase [Maledivibacter halophilus]|uniref:D-alanyl-D-alanine carboxypeptidase n=1 Tax=Maledivibacter halophilus TaxID=36842 RepID=A0A1T5MVB4_9FIRM|nr:M15 family metallopeptidase [Maledivibacter halophilus]SKC92152.1 D-alanyl-D-alanine carboxypeptidase [Maledivibacter halophilus]
MNKKFILIIFIFLFIITGCVQREWIQNNIVKGISDNSYDVTMKRDLLCLMMAYPEHIIDIEKSKNNEVYIVLKSGKKILYDDKRNKNNNEKLVNPDLQDMMEQLYPLEDINGLVDTDFNPGRIRVYSLLKEVYGKSSGQVESNLENVKIGYKYYPFNKVNKGSSSLKNVMKEIAAIAENKENIYSFVYPPSGTFNYRYISGTNRLSPHSFGIAVDLKRDKRDYWKWASREEGEKRLISYSKDLVRVFEKNNFIWGGKWGHFDILHFEYRPELILKARYFSKKPALGNPWHDGINSSDTNIKKYISIINEKL